MVKECTNDQIRNPSSGRCVKKTGKIGISLDSRSTKKRSTKKRSTKKRSTKKRSTKKRSTKKDCTDDKIINPVSGRCVKKTGKIGMSLVSGSIKKRSLRRRSLRRRSRRRSKVVGTKLPSKHVYIDTHKRSRRRSRKRSVKKGPVENRISQIKSINLIANIDASEDKFVFPMEILHKNVNITQYKGSDSILCASLRYIQQKYKKDVCVVNSIKLPISKNKMTNCYLWENKENSITYYRDQNKIVVPPTVLKSFQSCIKGQSRFVVIDLYIISTIKQLAHSNMLVYDRLSHSLERFEPHGGIYSDMDDQIQKFFMEKNLIHHYYSPLEYCPFLGWQSIQSAEKLKNKTDPGGFCMAWSIFYLDIRIGNPNLSRVKVIDKTISYIKNNSDSFTQTIRNYAEILFQIDKELRIKK